MGNRTRGVVFQYKERTEINMSIEWFKVPLIPTWRQLLPSSVPRDHPGFELPSVRVSKILVAGHRTPYLADIGLNDGRSKSIMTGSSKCCCTTYHILELLERPSM